MSAVPRLQAREALVGHTRGVSSVALSAHGARLLSGSLDRTLRLRNVGEGALAKTLLGETSDVNAVALSPDGRHLLSGAKSREVRLWDLATGSGARVLAGHEGVVRGVAFLPDGRWALSAAEDKTVRLWEVEAGRCEAAEATSGAALCLALSEAGRRAAVGTYDRRVVVRDVSRPA